jgi:hypothetical protein
MAEAFRGWLNAWKEWRVKAEEYLEHDGDRVLVPFRFSARGNASGLEVGQMRGERVPPEHRPSDKACPVHGPRGRALAALGLPSEAGSPDS